MSNTGVCSTALATRGLLKILSNFMYMMFFSFVCVGVNSQENLHYIISPSTHLEIW